MLILVENLTFILLFICLIHLILKITLQLVPQISCLDENASKTHFALTCVTIGLIISILLSVIVDLFFRTYKTFKWIFGLNITLVFYCLFEIGYLFGYSGEIFFAIISELNTCRQLGLNDYLDYSAISNNATDEQVRNYKNELCSIAVHRVIGNILIDLLINIILTPFHILITAYFWQFARRFRPKSTVNLDHFMY